ncbi:MAG: single-stranded-DNA-specific exonuclease RecJ [Acutalibacter sp.]|jgi:single-stranded-DNA-specific exonuclease
MVNIKKWELARFDEDVKETASQIAAQYSMPFFLALLLTIRGFTQPDQIRALLGGGTFSDPFLMKDMDKAVQRIHQAIDGFQRIAVYGDYDADGVTATSILYSYLVAVGANVMYYIPQREGEGYGMNLQAVEKLHSYDVDLIVTVDNGIASVKEAARAKELGMDVVITDHHRPQGVLPDACAVVDAFQKGDTSPFKELCGAGVALKLVIALEDGDADSVLEEYADLAALGTVADVVPVLGENRDIVKAGLRLITQGGRPGVDALLRASGMGDKTLTATGLAFTVIPRINATGRMGSPDRAVHLLTSESFEEADPLSEEICGENDRRRAVEAEIAQEVFAKIEGDDSLLYSRIIVVDGRNWHHGVIGIVSSRVTERYGKPSIIISSDGEEARGSGRSVEGFSLFEAVSSCKDLMERYGGHPMAAGVSLKTENIPAFRERINQYAARVCPEMPALKVKIDCKLRPAALSRTLVDSLSPLEPYGTGNPQPLFGLYSMTLKQIVPVGGGGTLRLLFEKAGTTCTCMKFKTRLEDFPYAPGDLLDLAVTMEPNDFNGRADITISVQDLRLSGVDADKSLHSYRVYEKIRRREPLTPQEAKTLLPTHEDLAVVYRKLTSLAGRAFSVHSMTAQLKGMELGKLLLCLDMFQETHLVALQSREEIRTAEILPTKGKVDIFTAPMYQRAKALAGN